MPFLPLSRLTRITQSLRGLVRRQRSVAIPSCYALLQITVDPAKCNHCGNCSRVCPMNIDLPAYIDNQQPVDADDCILCQTCVNTCAQHALSVTSTLDQSPHRIPR